MTELAETREREVKQMCVDTAKLRGKITERGLTQRDLAQQIGMDASTFSRKMAANGVAFTIGQMHRITDILALTGEEAANIFLCKNSHLCE